MVSNVPLCLKPCEDEVTILPYQGSPAQGVGEREAGAQNGEEGAFSKHDKTRRQIVSGRGL